MTPKWRYFLSGILIGVILMGLLQLIIDRSSIKKTVMLLPSPTATASDQRQIESNEGNKGKINLNTANPDDLASLPGIGPVKAQSIIDFRDKYGDFQSIEELLYITGIGESLLTEIADLIYIE